MRNSFWEQFTQTGKVDYYLHYREGQAYKQAADGYAVRSETQSERKSSDSDEDSNWYRT